MRRIAWPALSLIVLVALAIGSWPSGKALPTAGERVDALSSQIRCPTCAGLSVAESDTPLARSAREDIARRVAEGQSDREIRQFFVSRYGPSALTSPSPTGFFALAWIAPVVLAVLGCAGVAWAIRRWMRNSGQVPTEAQRRLVEKALQKQ